MRFSVASVALLAGVAMAGVAPQETVYETKQVTITSCAPDVPDCPGSATAPVPAPAESTAYVTVTDCGPDVPDCPAHSTYVTSSVFVPVPTPSNVQPEVPPYPTGPAEPELPSTSVVYYTTCIPTVTSSIITLTPPAPTGTGGVPVPPVPTGTGVIPAPPSGTSVVPPVGTSPPDFDNAAAVSGVSFAMAGFAAIAALFLA